MSLRASLSSRLIGRVTILGVGNRLKGDDGAGPALIDRLFGRVSAECIDTGEVPENFLEVVVRTAPDTILIVDAGDFGGEAGAARLFEAAAVAESGISTHGLSLSAVCLYLEQRLGVAPVVLAVQPAHIRLDEPLSEPVSASLDRLVSLLCEVLPL